MHSDNTMKAVDKDRVDGAFCDLEIVCGESRFQAHRLIVCSQSAIIRTACVGPWKEAACGTFEIKESDPVLVKRMLDYMYTGQYDGAPYKVPVKENKRRTRQLDQLTTECPVMFHMKMIDLADMYMVEGLRLLATKKVDDIVVNKDISSLLTDFIPKIYAITSKSGPIIRKIIVEIMRERLLESRRDRNITSQLKDTMKIVPEFTYEMLGSYADEPLLGYCQVCRLDKAGPVAPLTCRCETCDCEQVMQLW
ncbi:hypothetical protein E4U42_007238 [Claviceps africana]|uniref:BTB domain-containing protein n=1 Tax=Claviceps africana TaxID=83212 RepID=A0A8K0NF89_9HYPO|nr:hypothetical protein E4U42_007238 [Claviceps africana]